MSKGAIIEEQSRIAEKMGAVEYGEQVKYEFKATVIFWKLTITKIQVVPRKSSSSSSSSSSKSSSDKEVPKKAKFATEEARVCHSNLATK